MFGMIVSRILDGGIVLALLMLSWLTYTESAPGVAPVVKPIDSAVEQVVRRPSTPTHLPALRTRVRRGWASIREESRVRALRQAEARRRRSSRRMSSRRGYSGGGWSSGK